MHLNRLMVASWGCFLAAIAASAFYQWVAVRVIEYYERGDPDDLTFPLTVVWLWPEWIYGAMVSTFFLGSLLLVLAAFRQLRASKPLKQEPRRAEAEGHAGEP